MCEIPEKEKHHRRSIRLKEYDNSHPGAYFVTVCAYNWKHLFGEIVNSKMRLNRIGKMIQSVWSELPQNYQGVNTDAFVVMPNHIHGIIVLSSVGATPCGCPPPGQAQGPAPT
ncbi:MAG: transposase, partial [candidate division Zixibacteria bacterium]|nr:transposase [candidate division Zixibacteria bacterium]